MCCPVDLFLYFLHLPKSAKNRKGDSDLSPIIQFYGAISPWRYPKLWSTYILSISWSAMIIEVLREKVPPHSLRSCSRFGPKSLTIM